MDVGPNSSPPLKIKTNTLLTLRSIVGVVGTRSNAGAEVEGVGSDDEVGTSLALIIKL